MNESDVSTTARPQSGAAHPEERPAAPASAPPRPEGAVRRSGWTGGRITAVVIGSLLVVISLGLLGSGGTALWAEAQRDAAGYVTTGAHDFSTSGSALATERIHLGSPGVEWFYSPFLFEQVRIRVTPDSPGSPLFVGIGRSRDVSRYLAGVSGTVISDFWESGVRTVGGGTPATAPGEQDFWVASDAGRGPRTLLWEPENGSWTIVVMNADGRPGIDTVTTDLGATMPSLLLVALVSLVAAGLFALGGALLIAAAIRRVSRERTV